MFPFLQFVNLAGRDSCLLLRGFLAKKEAGSSVSDRVFLESRSSCCTTSITSSSWPTLRWLPLLKRSRLWSANLPERTTCPPSSWWRGARPGFHSTWIGGWWRRMRAITRDFRNPGRRCSAQRLGGRVVRHRPLQLLTSAGTVKSRRGSSTSCEQVGSKGWLTKWDREKMEGNLTVRWRCAGFQSELWVEAAGGGIVLLVG